MITRGTRHHPFPSSQSVYEALEASGKPLRILGTTLGGDRVVCAETGGERLPPIVVTAGSHSPEVAGVTAALRLVNELRSSHKTYVIPMRDPFGFNTFDHCLSGILGRPVTVETHAATVALLERFGTVLLQDKVFCLALVDEVGVVSMETGAEPMGFDSTLNQLQERLAKDPVVAERMRGRRFFLPSGMPFSEGAGVYGRTYTGVMSPEGQQLSLSQFFGRADAPAEVACIDAFLQEVRPGLIFDCHEDFGREAYFPARRHDRDPTNGERIVRAMRTALVDAGYPLADFDQFVAGARMYRPYWKPYHQPSGLSGLFWTDGVRRGIGFNLADYALRFGFSMPIETGAEASLADRTDCHLRAVMAGVAAFEHPA
jgi:hypothetical protein